VIEKQRYIDAMESHLSDPQIYTNADSMKTGAVETKINSCWSKIALLRKLPKQIISHHKSSNTTFAKVRGLIKTHKPGPGIKIRPVVNIRDSPTYKLSWLLFTILQPLSGLSKFSIKSSMDLVSHLNTLPISSVSSHPYPISLDVKDMYTNIPVPEAVQVTIMKAQSSNIPCYGLTAEDVKELLLTTLQASYITFNGRVYKQIKGLPMGNKLSGLLAGLFMDNMEERIVPTLDVLSYVRYVDDIFMLVADEETAHNVHNIFNANGEGLSFELEKPNNLCLQLLDISVKTSLNGIQIEFHRKQLRSDVFLHSESALPSRTNYNVIIQEWSRILSRTQQTENIPTLKRHFMNMLKINGYRRIPHLPNQCHSNNHSLHQPTQKFFLSVPFFGDSVNKRIKRILNSHNIQALITHKGRPLLSIICKEMMITLPRQCMFSWCPLRSHICFRSMVTYRGTCRTCGSQYVGSTSRQLHLRLREHLTRDTSAIFNHNLTCGNNWRFEVTSQSKDVVNMRLAEAILIYKDKPSLNSREDPMSAHIL
jgi:hypothetical protein